MIRQPNNYTCGPIVLYNLQTWSQSKILTYRQLYILTKCNPQTGTFTKDFEIALAALIKISNLKLIEKQIQPKKLSLNNNRQAIVMEYFTHLQFLHFILIVMDQDQNLIMINEGAENKEIPLIQSAKHLKIKRYEKNGIKYPIVWKIQL